MNSLDLLGFAAATLTSVSFVPQAIKTIRSRDTRAISLWMYATFTAGVALWWLYGVRLGSWPVMAANAATFALAAIILSLKIRYG
jgi:MtN3 and saliva related transmembrane protein